VAAVAAHGEGSFEAKMAPERLGEVRRSVIDPARAGRELGWHARVGLANGIASTLDSLR